MDAGEQKIREVHSLWINAVNAGDLGRLLTLMTDDAVFVSPGQEPVGREEFSANFTKAHERFQVGCASDLEEVMVAGEIAYTRSRDTLSVSLRNGSETTQLAGHRITIYRGQPDGRWLLARDVHTLSPMKE